MSAYQFTEIENKWQQRWVETQLYKVKNDISKPKYYALDMFPYPSGAGLHVGHPLGYIASDIVSRYKRLKGYNVLHPMGYDAFGLPAEQYAIQTGQHPAVTTENNIATFRRQLDIMGFSYDWSREVRTSDANYYKWTQWIFTKFFTHWYDKKEAKAKPLADLIQHFEKLGTHGINAACTMEMQFDAATWNSADEIKKEEITNNYRLAFINETTVNWCAELGTVLANEEVVNGVSERGGYPVVRKKMKQWALRITAYADKLIEGLSTVDWSDSIKEIQKNWIARSEGAEIKFRVRSLESRVVNAVVEVFTTRPDTIFGATFMVLAPEYEGLADLCSDDEREKVLAYANTAKNRSEIDRMADTKKTGVFTGTYCINPFTNEPIQIWVSDYVLAGYGTGAIMAVPAHDERDFEFATAFNLPIIPVIKPANGEIEMPMKEAFSAKDGICFNSGFLDGLTVKNAVIKAIEKVEELNIGKRKINYKLRDAGFGRQRYWGEPFPIIYDEKNIPHLAPELPVELPVVESYKPTGNGESPLAAVSEWVNVDLNEMFAFQPSPFMERGRGEENNPQDDAYYIVNEPPPEYNINNLDYAKTMRQDSTAVEEKMWDLLRNNQLGVKFKRQQPIGNYIADFASLTIKLIVEFDGSVHKDAETKIYDETRKNYLEEQGYKIIRFWNSEVEKDAYNVRDRILQVVQSLTPSPSPQVERGATAKIPGRRETDTMPGWAGSSWYFLRYMDPNNTTEFASKEALDYWKQVDLYVGGSEHATGHLLYSRFWTKFLNDLGYLNFDEPFKKLVNQGMIGGEDGQKMSKRWGNVVNPDDICRDYGADTLRMYEMFLGPLTDSKPWNTHGIEGVSRFLGKFWRLFFDKEIFAVNDEEPTAEEYKILHKTIKKITYDIDNMGFNTSVSAFMVAVNELGTLQCKKRKILEPMLILLAPFAPHITEELWEKLHIHTMPGFSPLQYGEGAGGEEKTQSIHLQSWPVHDEKYLVESAFSYPISINGKTRTQIEFPLDMESSEIEKTVLMDEMVIKWMEGKPLKKMIVVKGRIVNVVV